jgi:ABC-2 type transport system ATP-binding protein
MSDEKYIQIVNLDKTFGGEYVLKDINVSFGRSKIHGIIGRNGSGKTMLLKAICGFIVPTSGYVTVAEKHIGRDVDFPERTGIILEAPGFLPYYSGFKNLSILASVRGSISRERIREVMCSVGLDPLMKKATGKYSLGMRQRLGLAQALMEDPELLLLDEPMNGLDKHGIEEVRSMLMSLRDAGKTLLIATHIVEDIERMCDTVCEMDAGELKTI